MTGIPTVNDRIPFLYELPAFACIVGFAAYDLKKRRVPGRALNAAEEVPELHYVRVLSVTDAKGISVDNTKEPVEDEENSSPPPSQYLQARNRHGASLFPGK